MTAYPAAGNSAIEYPAAADHSNSAMEVQASGSYSAAADHSNSSSRQAADHSNSRQAADHSNSSMEAQASGSYPATVQAVVQKLY